MNYQQRFGSYALQPYNFTPVPRPTPAPSVPSQQVIGGSGEPTPQPMNPMGMNPFRRWSGRETSGMGSASDRNMREGEMMGRGYADLSLGNLGKLGGIAMGFMGGPVGLGMLGARTALSGAGIGENPFGFEGFGRFDQDLIDAVKSGKMTRGQAMSAKNERDATRGPRGATDSRSGQVRGGGTGHVGGGLTQGGPR